MKKIILLMGLLCYSSWLCAQSPVFYLKYNEPDGTTTTHEEVSNTDLSINNQFGKPERVVGVTGNALRTDGFSTWIQTTRNLGLTSSFTFETWLVLESYPSDQEVPYANLTPSAIVSQTDGTNGFAMFINTFGVWNFTITINGTKYACQAPNPFPLYTWTHVAATLNGSTGTINLYLNGSQVATMSTPANGTINTVTSPLIIGKSNIDIIAGIFLINALDATYDETKIYNSALLGSTIANDYASGSSTITTTGDQAIAVSPIRFSNDLQRPIFHAMPPANWTNEPHGMVGFNGRYHMFYQRTPNGPFKYEMHWGHLTSTDFVHWLNTRDALWPQLELSPTTGYDMKGIWSGDVIVNNGVPHAFYTTVNHTGPYNPGIGHATSDTTFKVWTKSNPVIDRQFVNDFRDPYIFKDGTTWVMIIGAALVGSGGLDCYTSTDLVTWTHKTDFCTVPYSQMDIGSVIWEMPVFEPIGGGKYILEANPIGGSIAKYGPTYTRGVYWVGTYTNGQFTPDYNLPKSLDVIHGHLSPTVARNVSNQLTGIGIVDERRNSQAQLNAGWCHLFSLPRIWSLLPDNKTLGQAPAPQLSSLRLAGTQQNLSNINVSSTFPVSMSSGTTFELIATADTTTTASSYGVNFRISTDRSEITRLYYDVAAQNLVFDKSNSTLSADDEEKVLISEPYDPVAFGKPSTFHVFMDNSVMDVFINEKAAFSARIYPTRADSKGVELYSQGGTTTFTSVSSWSTALQAIPVTGISLNKTSTSIPVGRSDTLIATISPSNATNRNVTWSSNNTAVATVNANGIVTAVAAGNAIITVTSQDSAKTATCTITVINQSYMAISPQSITPLRNDNATTGSSLIMLYPNPVDNTFTVDLSTVKETNAMLQITDLYGKVINKQHVSGGNRYLFSVRQLNMPKGVYVASVKGKQCNFLFKIIVN
jgi:sucrose-6-phosphate hydrolase SacC (GH32 family)